ncbi:MAG: restriction endonuclease [Roseiflexus castenholzii]|uniref:restriction endonuclease n=1 Tax=Roseiflexus castenholzii TaxID=120962 RepID=UPI000CB1CD81|nr:MAG: restriction endonuclease [Roseiflexus castenholzii]
MSRRRSRRSSDAGIAVSNLLVAPVCARLFWTPFTQLAFPWQVAAAVLACSILFLLFLFSIDLFRAIRQRNLLRKALLTLTPSEFEERVLLLLKDLGWTNLRLRGGSGDRGVDLEGEFQGQRYIVQCKRYSKAVPPSMVRDLAGALHIQRADRALLVTTSSFTRQGYEEARNQPIELWDGDILARKIKEADVLRTDPARRRNVWRGRVAVLATFAVANASCVLFAFVSASAPALTASAVRTSGAPSSTNITNASREGMVFPSPFSTSTTAIPVQADLPPASQAPTPTERPVLTTTVFNGGNVRAAPNLRGAVLDQIHAGEIVELLGRSPDGNWFYIRNPRNQVGWTHRTLLNLDAGVNDRLDVLRP